MSRLARSKLLFLPDEFAKLSRARVLILGAGGVGGAALDCLWRTGVGSDIDGGGALMILDFDRFEISNQNRQIGSLSGLGRPKVAVLSEMFAGINALEAKITQDFIEGFDFTHYDVVLDCIDSLHEKVNLALKIASQNQPPGVKMPRLLCSTGSAKKLDPSRIKFASIWDSYGDRFARKLRVQLQRKGFCGDFFVCFSDEVPHCVGLGSFSGVTASFGLRLASETVRLILEK